MKRRKNNLTGTYVLTPRQFPREADHSHRMIYHEERQRINGRVKCGGGFWIRRKKLPA